MINKNDWELLKSIITESVQDDRGGDLPEQILAEIREKIGVYDVI